MEKPIRHVHVRRFAAPLAEVIDSIDALWSGSERDALPRELAGWRRTPASEPGFAAGTRFGHGPFSFYVEGWDGRTLRARIETAGFRGYHGFVLCTEGDRVVVTHELDAQLRLPHWLFWQLLIAPSHDWAVEAMFDRMQGLLSDPTRSPGPLRRPPVRMRVFVAARQLTRRLFRAPTGAQRRAASGAHAASGVAGH